MKKIVADTSMIAACGLYCGACRKFLLEKCPGCKNNERATWCKIRRCCCDKEFDSCAQCGMAVEECKTFSNFIGKIFAFLFNSDRGACIRYIRENGKDAFVREMVRRKEQTMKKRIR